MAGQPARAGQAWHSKKKVALKKANQIKFLSFFSKNAHTLLVNRIYILYLRLARRTACSERKGPEAAEEIGTIDGWVDGWKLWGYK